MQLQIYLLFAILAQLSRFVVSKITNYSSSDSKNSMHNNIYLEFQNETITLTFSDVHLDIKEEDRNSNQSIRIKRQSGAGKFPEAAKMPQMKLLKLILQQVKNLWADVYVGSPHPLHPETPKAIVFLFKQKITQVFFPEVGVDFQAAKITTALTQMMFNVNATNLMRERREIFDKNKKDGYRESADMPVKKLSGYIFTALKQILDAIKNKSVLKITPTPKPLMYLKDYFLSHAMPANEAKVVMKQYHEGS